MPTDPKPAPVVLMPGKEPGDPPRPAPAVLSPEEAATFLRIRGRRSQQLTTLRYLRERKGLGGVRSGRSFAYPLEELLRWVKENTT